MRQQPQQSLKHIPLVPQQVRQLQPLLQQLLYHCQQHQQLVLMFQQLLTLFRQLLELLQHQLSAHWGVGIVRRSGRTSG